MADPLYLSLWFPSFTTRDMMLHSLSVLRQFPFSEQAGGISYLAVHPVSWNEPTVLERRFRPGIAPEEAVSIASDLLHEDYAFVFEVFWDLWSTDTTGKQWSLSPARVRVIAPGAEFDERASEGTGHIEVDFGLDLTAEAHVRSNVHKLVDFTNKMEKNAHASGRLLWSDSEDNLAQKLIARLQKVQ